MESTDQTRTGVKPESAAPTKRRAALFFDGQNLFNAAKSRFGYNFPNFDIKKLGELICTQENLALVESRFYTGLPDQKYDFQRNQFWQNKLRGMGRAGIVIFSRKLVYRKDIITLDDGEEIEHYYSQVYGKVRFMGAWQLLNGKASG